MTPWREFCVGARDVTANGEGLLVQFSNGRQHRLDIRATEDLLELRGVVARRSIVDHLERATLLAWERNRASSLVGFRVDDRGRLVGESWVPTAGLTREEFLIYVRSAAAACDLFEFQLTGRDRE